MAVISSHQLVLDLPDDDPYRREVEPVLVNLAAVKLCALVNRALGCSVSPLDINDWPLELIDVAVAWAGSSNG